MGISPVYSRWEWMESRLCWEWTSAVTTRLGLRVCSEPLCITTSSELEGGAAGDWGLWDTRLPELTEALDLGLLWIGTDLRLAFFFGGAFPPDFNSRAALRLAMRSFLLAKKDSQSSVGQSLSKGWSWEQGLQMMQWTWGSSLGRNSWHEAQDCLALSIAMLGMISSCCKKKTKQDKS